MREHRRAFGRNGSNGEGALDHFHLFSHPKQSQSIFLFSVQYAFFPKTFTIVFDCHAHGCLQFLNLHFRPTGLGMAGNIGKRFLGDTKEDRAFVPFHQGNKWSRIARKAWDN